MPATSHSTALMVAREPGVLAGIETGMRVFEILDGSVEATALIEDGTRVDAGTAVARIRGATAVVLAGERTSLNIVGHLSGIATATRAAVDLVAHTRARIVDTRKTTPGLRALEKYAVRAGGGSNHRFGLYDAVLIKDNHLAAVGGDVAGAVKRARNAVGHVVGVEVEIDRVAELETAIAAGADAVLLDNMTVGALTQAVEINAGRVTLEASGGITLDNVAQVAETGVDLISIGALTHSAPNWDVGLDIESD